VVDSFRGVRWYLSKVTSHMMWVDPNLRANRGLVERLRKWAECWEAGAKYLLPSAVRHAMNNLVASFHQVGKFSQAFSDMCDTQDAELFLVLPRLVWLMFLSAPETFAPLLKILLPHRLQEETQGKELAATIAQFRNVAKLLEPQTHSKNIADKCLSEDIIRIITVFAVGDESECDAIKQSLDSEASDALSKLLRDLEAWSMELQRHRATEWNQCGAILVRCLVGDREEAHEKAGDFYV